MGRRPFCLSVQRKNHEHKKWGYFPVRIPQKHASVFKVSVPLSHTSLNVEDQCGDQVKGKNLRLGVPVNRINFCLSLKDQSSVLANLKRQLR